MNKKFKISKNDFIDFLISASPAEVNKYILEKGKKPKPITPVIFFNKKKK